MARGFFACDAKETKETKKQQKSTEMTEIDRNRQKSTGAVVFLVFLASLRGALLFLIGFGLFGCLRDKGRAFRGGCLARTELLGRATTVVRIRRNTPKFPKRRRNRRPDRGFSSPLAGCRPGGHYFGLA